MRSTRSEKAARRCRSYRRGTSHGFDPDLGPDDETPEGNRAAIANSISYDDLAPELMARLERMRKLINPS